MLLRTSYRSLLVGLFLLAVLAVGTMGTLGAAPPQASADLFSGLQWRNIGPFHGGRIAAVAGVIGEPGVYYVGMPAGGIWKTTSAGVSWFPIFDQITQVDSIGADPGRALRSEHRLRRQRRFGAGIARRRHVQVHGRRQDVDAHRPRGHDEDQPNPDRPEGSRISSSSPRRATRATRAPGIYRTTDGGKTWQNTLQARECQRHARPGL